MCDEGPLHSHTSDGAPEDVLHTGSPVSYFTFSLMFWRRKPVASFATWICHLEHLASSTTALRAEKRGVTCVRVKRVPSDAAKRHTSRPRNTRL